MARIFAFMDIPFKVRSSTSARRRRDMQTAAHLNPQIVLKSKNRSRVAQPASRLRVWGCRRPVNGSRRSHGRRRRGAPRLPGHALTFSLFGNLLGALRRRAVLHPSIGARAAGHIVAAHRRCHQSIHRSHSHHPHHGQSQSQPSADARVQEGHHRPILGSACLSPRDAGHCFTGSRYMPPPPSRRIGRTTCGVITIASSATSRLLLLLVIS